MILMPIYRLLYSLYFLLVLLHSVFSKKTRAYVKARLKDRAPLDTTPKDRRFLIHAASGEAEYAFALIRELKKQIPNAYIVFSFYSPSYEKQIQRNPCIDYVLPLPFDFPGPTRALLKTLDPEIVFISRTDLWPEFLNQCQQLKIPSLLFSRTQSFCPFYKFPWFKAWVFKKLSLISAVSKADQNNLQNILGRKSKTKVLVHGDTRWDQAFYKIAEFKNQAFLQKKFFVAGSLWPEDFRILAQAWKKEYGQLVLAPHEPKPAFLKKIHTEMQKQGYKCIYSSKTSASPSESFDVLMLDKFGVLHKSYLGAYGALIGGSFKSKVHSVMESLVSQTPVIVGPYYQNNREACDYLKTPLNHASKNKTHCVQSVSKVIDLQKAIEELSKRYEDITTNTYENTNKNDFYLSYSWAKPICEQVQDSPTKALVNDIRSRYSQS